ncbi:uncharacterized protein LOC143918678 [Arctopsyche grandis]|uniref:uncharacterized protein LOC143918678 n=1 Tax=Arctopsyche grandis TaxID=121162 RepID=UPI00406D80FA
MEKDAERAGDNPPPYTPAANFPGVHHHQPYPNAPPPYNAPPPGYQPYQNVAPVGFMPSYGATQPTTTTNIVITPPIMAVGACPACRIGMLEDDFTCLGILCAIACFPIGILCCLAMKNRRCSNCGAYFG